MRSSSGAPARREKRRRSAFGTRRGSMKIVFLSQSGAIGGAERVLLDLMAELHQCYPHWAIDLIAPAAGPLVEDTRAIGVAAHVVEFPAALARLGDSAPASRAGHLLLQLGRLGASSPAVHRYANRLNGMLVARDPDLIHANGFKMHLLGARAAPPRSALVWHVHDFVGARPLMRRLLRAYAGRCDMAVANSRAVAADLRTALGPSPPDVVRVGLVATAAHWKGHRVFLRALALLPRALPVRGYVIGGAVYHTRQSQISLAALRQEVTRLGLAERVGFTGFLPDIAPALHALDIVVHPSIQPEPFGLVVAEAFACARAVITSGSGG